MSETEGIHFVTTANVLEFLLQKGVVDMNGALQTLERLRPPIKEDGYKAAKANLKGGDDDQYEEDGREYGGQALVHVLPLSFFL